MKALVTGGTGFIGSNIAARLVREGWEVVITGSDAETWPEGFKGKYLQPSFLGLDFGAIGKIDAVFHEAAINNTVLTDRAEMMRANLDSTKKLFEYARDASCKRIVYASSTAVYGDVAAPFREDGPVNPLNV